MHAQEVAAACGVRAMPTFQAFLNGEKVGELQGANPPQLEALVKRWVAGTERGENSRANAYDRIPASRPPPLSQRVECSCAVLTCPRTCVLVCLLLSVCSVAEKASKGGAGTGQKLGGGSSSEAAPDSADDRRAKMAAAAEARLKAMGA